MYRKNTASQFIHFQGVDATTGGIKSGVTWTARRCIDGTFAAAGLTVTEDGSTGWYKAALTQADTNGNDIGFNFTGTGAVPQTVNIVTTAADPTDAVRFGLTALPNAAAEASGGLFTRGTGAGQINQDANGRIDANAKAWIGGTIPAVNVTGVPLVDAKYLLGTIFSTPTVAGIPNVNAKTWNDLATVELPLVPTTAGRKLDVSAGGEAGLDWANVGTPGSTVNLSATTVNLTNTLTTYTGNTVQTGDSYARIGAAGVGLTAVGLTGTQTFNNTGTWTGNLSGSVGSVVGLTASNLDATISSRLASASYTAPPTPAQNATAVFTTQLTESYAALHAVPTLAQGIFEIRSLLAEKAVGSTTLTTKKIDGSTTAETFTLDSASAPTSITRAT